MGIAQRRIRVKYVQKSRKDPRIKPLVESIKTIGDWIQTNRRKKNMTACHLAAKMGIATALIHSWEDGTGQLDSRQLKVLARFLEIDTLTFPHAPEKRLVACRTEIERQVV